MARIDLRRNAVGQPKLRATAGRRSRPTRRHPLHGRSCGRRILVGLAEASFGKAAPENALRGDEGSRPQPHRVLLPRPALRQEPAHARLRLAALRSIARWAATASSSSTRSTASIPSSATPRRASNDVESNSKLYARIDRDRSYAMFGDFEADMNDSRLAGYSRKLTGVKLHSKTRTAISSPSRARVPTPLSRATCSPPRVSASSVSRTPTCCPARNPSCSKCATAATRNASSRASHCMRSLDYNLDSADGRALLPPLHLGLRLRPQPRPGRRHLRAPPAGMSSAVYTGRAVEEFRALGLRLGLSLRRSAAERSSARTGSAASTARRSCRTAARSDSNTATQPRRNGDERQHLRDAAERHAAATPTTSNYAADQVLGRRAARRVRARRRRFLQPFGATVTPGSRRTGATLDLKPGRSRSLRFGFLNERNHTANVDNSRDTLLFLVARNFQRQPASLRRLRLPRLTDSLGRSEHGSNLVTVGAQYRPTDKLELSVKREQNLGEADPTFPNQTTLAARYRWNEWANIFFTQRLASAPIMPISDTSATGFASTGSRRETAIGVETKLGRYTNVVSRYQLENGINGTDSFAVIGLQNRLPVSETALARPRLRARLPPGGRGPEFHGRRVRLLISPERKICARRRATSCATRRAASANS